MTTLGVMLRPATLETFNGDVVSSALEILLLSLPPPVRIRERGHELVVVRYDECKRRSRRVQRDDT